MCDSSSKVGAEQVKRLVLDREAGLQLTSRGVVVYIKSPVARVVFQLWKSVFELRNKGFF